MLVKTHYTEKKLTSGKMVKMLKLSPNNITSKGLNQKAKVKVDERERCPNN